MGTIVVIIVLAVLAAAVALLAAGLVEVYAELRQVREVLRLQDQPHRTSLTTFGRQIAELVPDPPAPLRLDPDQPNYLLVLSNSCSVCQTIGSGLASTRPPWASALTVLVASDSEHGGHEFAERIGLDSRRLLVDELGKYAKQLGVDSSPTIVRVQNGRLDSAATLSSLRQLELFVEERIA